jgi:hypothetical protein
MSSARFVDVSSPYGGSTVMTRYFEANVKNLRGHL